MTVFKRLVLRQCSVLLSTRYMAAIFILLYLGYLSNDIHRSHRNCRTHSNIDLEAVSPVIQNQEVYFRTNKTQQTASVSHGKQTQVVSLQTTKQAKTVTTAPAFNQSESQIILMTYARCGSSLTSEILQQDRRVFYSFEPLYSLMEKFVGKEQAKRKTFFTNESKTVQENFTQKALKLLDQYLTCSFQNLSLAHINNYQLRNSINSRMLWGCMQHLENTNPSKLQACFLRATNACLHRPIKMIKTIRLRATGMRKLLAKYPKLKVLYLIRDPRASLTSQQGVFKAFGWKDVAKVSSYYCKMFAEDLDVMGSLLRQYPHRIKIVRYEALAENPINETKRIFDTLGLKFSESVERFVFKKTMAGIKSTSPYDTARASSVVAANSWRQKLDFKNAKTIDSNCGHVYQAFGYRPVNSLAHLKNMSLKLHRPLFFRGQRLM